MRALWGGVAGLLFGTGLAIAGMTRADKVIAFLDLADQWDPSLAFVMVGAIGVHLVLFRLILRRDTPVLGGAFQVPSRSDITPQLVGGASLFGIGWAIGGYCPGPGIASVGSGSPHVIAFMVALVAGMLAYGMVGRSTVAAEAR